MSWPKVALLSVCFAVASLAGAQKVHRIAPDVKEKQDLAALQLEHDRSQMAWAKQPKNAKVKKQYVFATVKLGMHTMYAVSLPSNYKYPTALRLFNEALKADPTNKDARDAKHQIEAAYLSINKRKKG